MKKQVFSECMGEMGNTSFCTDTHVYCRVTYSQGSPIWGLPKTQNISNLQGWASGKHYIEDDQNWNFQHKLLEVLQTSTKSSIFST